MNIPGANNYIFEGEATLTLANLVPGSILTTVFKAMAKSCHIIKNFT